MPRIRPSRGTHVTLARERLEVDAGVIVPAGGGRGVFVVPWLGRTLVGTTDNDYEGSLEHVPPSDDDIAYLLEALNGFFETELSVADLTGAYAGVRPLISTGDPKKSVDISRKAELYETSSGLVTITGGKLTTWRRMAKLAVDRIVEREVRGLPHTRDPARPAVDPDELQHVPSVDAHSREHLARRYGHAAQFVLRLAEAQPELGRQITPACRTSAPRRPSPLLTSRHRASATCCCGALAWASSTPAPSPRRRARRRGRWRGRWVRRSAGKAHPRRARRVGESSPAARACPGARSGQGGRMILRLRDRSLDLAGPTDGDRERHTRLVLRSSGPQDARRAGRERHGADRGRRGDRRRGRRSGRTDTQAIPAGDEAARVVPLVERLAAARIAVSVDTWRAPWPGRRSPREPR